MICVLRDNCAVTLPWPACPVPVTACAASLRRHRLEGKRQKFLAAMSYQLIKKASFRPHINEVCCCSPFIDRRRSDAARVFQVYSCAISPDGTLVATGGLEHILCITNIATRSRVYTAQFFEFVRVCLSFFVLTPHQGGRCRVVARRDASRCSDEQCCARGRIWQCYLSHKQQCALDRVHDRQRRMHICCSLTALSLLILCLVECVRVQSQWGRCGRWKR